MYTLTHTHTHTPACIHCLPHTRTCTMRLTHTRTHALHLGWHCFRLSIFWCSDTPLEACPCVLETSAVDRLYYVSLSPAQVPVQVFWHFSLLCKQRLAESSALTVTKKSMGRVIHQIQTNQGLGIFCSQGGSFWKK